MPSTLLRPWRSVWLPRVITAALLVAGLPLFLRMPLWCDLTLYDLAARNLLDGGRHYVDVFDTNLPGFVWVLTGIRAVLGFSPFALRCVDLVIVAGVVLLIDRVAKRGGATPATRWWAIAGVAALYPFAVEMAHCQRDTWMALPVMAAVLLRVRRAASLTSRPFWLSFAEGVLWAAAVWIKPHVVPMAAAVWLFTAWRIAASDPRPWRAFGLDLLGNVAGGLLLGAAGVLALVATGTWSEFCEVIGVWGPEYAHLARKELWEHHMRWDQELHWFPPWSLWLVLTVPLAVLSVIDAAPWVGRQDASRAGPVGRVLPAWLWDRDAGPDARFARAALSVLYVAWACQSFFVQRGYMYVHMSETLIMLGLWAAHRWSMPFVVLAWLLVASTAWVIADHNPAVREALTQYEARLRHEAWVRGIDSEEIPDGEPDREHYIVRHPLADWDRTRYWPDCWRTDLTEREQYVLWDRIKRYQDHEASPGWEELAEVADYLRSRGVKDGELIAWHDSPHVLYLTMGLKPGFRFMHINTVIVISQLSNGTVRSRDVVIGELGQKKGVARFAVSDLGWAALGQKSPGREDMIAPAPGPDDLYPPKLKNWMRASFPFNHRAVFRTRGGTGRYIVHELDPNGPFHDMPFGPDPHGHPPADK